MNTTDHWADHPMIEAARALGPAVDAVADEIESGRKLPQGLVEQITATDAFAMYVPRSVGGPEVHPLTGFATAEAFARHDGSVGWCVQVSAAVTSFMAWIDPAGLEAMVRSVPRVHLAGSARPLGVAREVDGGFVASGRWNYVSGVQHATVILASSIIEPVQGDPPLARSMFVPVGDGEIHANWNVMGMCGTGSDDFVLDEVFVPTERVGYRRYIDERDEPLYDPRLAMVTAWAPTAGVACGMARGAIDAVVDMGDVTTTMSPVALRDRSAVQDAIGEAETITSSARAYVVESIGAAWDALVSGSGNLPRLVSQAQLAITNSMHAAVKVADLCFHCAGTSAISTQNKLERYLRDTHTAVQHAAGQTIHARMGGKVVLGLENEVLNLREGPATPR
ncbi:MAG: acyl-CoA dehydrogenase family protein [Actinomycetota bacterium]|nr:acyl-CoA dehydrogenase family protein [Actinomycetota bacterium]